MPDWGLIAKYLAGEATASEKAIVESWANESIANRDMLQKLRKAMRPGRSAPDFSNTMEEDWNEIVGKRSHRKTGRRIAFPVSIILKVAAAMLVFISAGIVFWKINKNSDSAPIALISVDSVEQFTLQDGSAVWLNKNSSLDISADFGARERGVVLGGEAYFEIAKDFKKPFIVYSTKLKTQALGTAFNVKQTADGTVEIILVEGKVSVASTANKASVILLPGESALFKTTANEIEKKLNTDLNFLSWKTGVIRFESARLADVCLFLSEYYNVDLGVDKGMEDYKITTVFDNLTFDQATGIISQTLDLHTQKIGSSFIFIK